jgi:hypothetical protein
LAGIDFFAVTWALPPVKTGHLPPEGYKFERTQRCGLGLNSNQLRLILDEGEELIDIWSIFHFVVWIVYCNSLTPPVAPGTEAAMAVFKVLTSDKANKRMLLSIKTKLQVIHDIHPRHAPTTCSHDMLPRHTIRSG